VHSGGWFHMDLLGPGEDGLVMGVGKDGVLR
jgi:hypothetical protein